MPDANPGGERCRRASPPARYAPRLFKRYFSANVARGIHRRMRTKRVELINCHDCGKAVSFSATNCPHCGSIEPSGPYAFSRREARRFRAEQRNDNMMIVTTAACCGAGVLYGVLPSSSIFGAILAGTWYGLVGLLIGVPIAFAINLTRRLLG
jgi:hypothetical protein